MKPKTAERKTDCVGVDPLDRAPWYDKAETDDEGRYDVAGVTAETGVGTPARQDACSACWPASTIRVLTISRAAASNSWSAE